MTSSSCLWILRSFMVCWRLEAVLLFGDDFVTVCRVFRSECLVIADAEDSEIEMVYFSFVVNWKFISFEFKVTYSRNRIVNLTDWNLKYLIYIPIFSFHFYLFIRTNIILSQLHHIKFRYQNICLTIFTFQNWRKFNLYS